jgi:predicted transcriptional regulator
LERVAGAKPDPAFPGSALGLPHCATDVFGRRAAFFLSWTVVAFGEHGYAAPGCKISLRLQDKAEMEERAEIIEMTADIVSAYVGNNEVVATDLPTLIQAVHNALKGVSAAQEPVETAPKEPAVPIKRSVTPEFLVCLEDGRKFKSLKRHLRTKYNMSPEDYRAKWGLPKDYPMVAPNYAKARSDLAKQMGLGQGGRQTARKA